MFAQSGYALVALTAMPLAEQLMIIVMSFYQDIYSFWIISRLPIISCSPTMIALAKSSLKLSSVLPDRV